MYKKFLLTFIALILFSVPAHSENLWIFFKSENHRTPGDTVNRTYVETIAATGAEIRTVSRYFNAVSVAWDGSREIFDELGFVERVEAVASFAHKDTEAPKIAAIPAARKDMPFKLSNKLDYGFSYIQLEKIGVPYLHEKGLTGKGVIIGVLDSGFDTEGTACLNQLNVSHRRNFLTGGEDVNTGDYHGTGVLACLAGKQDSVFYGPAFGAEFLLAVTENVKIEARSEEDNWVAAMEWCDSLGADIISSSVVYDFGHDNPVEDYTPDQMDGKTSMIAKAAEIAVSRGIIVVSSAGNEGQASYTTSDGETKIWRIIATPADAEHVIAVGAVTAPADSSLPVIAPFSSRGPTADGRIKPDLVAPGMDIIAPVGEVLLVASGSSFAAPLVSGLCALLLEADPKMTPSEMSALLKRTALDLGDSGPDNDYGWGLADGIAAYNDIITVDVAEGDEKTSGINPALFSLGNPSPNPFNASVTIPVSVTKGSGLKIEVYDIAGRKAATLYGGALNAGIHTFTWNAEGMSSGVYFIRVVSAGYSVSKKVTLVK